MIVKRKYSNNAATKAVQAKLPRDTTEIFLSTEFNDLADKAYTKLLTLVGFLQYSF